MLVNGLRSTPLTELYIVFRKTAQMLDAAVFLADVDGGTAA
jgi:dihydroxyacetone kinase